MDDSFFVYLQQLELIAFFSGYPLLYMIVGVIKGKASGKTNFTSILFHLLPLAYALAGSLYVGLQLRNLYPDYSIAHIRVSIQQPYLTAWAVLSVLFWAPFLYKKPILSFLHSLAFFFLLARDLFRHILHPESPNNVVRNDMKIYTDSLFLHLSALTLVALIFFLARYINRTNRPILPKS